MIYGGYYQPAGAGCGAVYGRRFESVGHGLAVGLLGNLYVAGK